MSEFRVFIDLISAEDKGPAVATGPNRTLMAKMMLEAGSAYASLIYDFGPEDGFFRFVSLAEVVCSYLDSDRHVAAKLAWCRENVSVEELARVQKSAGSSEKSALKRAGRMNESGVYVIGGGGVRMEVGEERLDCEELKDLESILMLGQSVEIGDASGDRQVIERFVGMFGGVVRLGELCSVVERIGCRFFDGCELRVVCGGGGEGRVGTCVVELSGGLRLEGDCGKWL